jgi:hypothetical protein
LGQKPDASFPKAMSEAQLEGAYRFFGNVKVRPDDILMPHVRQTLERMPADEVSLVVHDSSTLSFGSEGCREGLGPCIARKQHFILHCSLAVTADGYRRPLGVVASSAHVAENNSDGTLQQRWSDHVRAVHGLGLSTERVVHEEYFKALKTGCAIEKRQLGDIQSLTNALALFIPIAWSVLLMRNESRENPDRPATEILEPDELIVLRSKARKPLAPNPTINEAVLAIAALGGHLKRNGDPGWQTIARGYETLRATVDGWRLYQSTNSGNVPQFRDQS